MEHPIRPCHHWHKWLLPATIWIIRLSPLVIMTWVWIRWGHLLRTITLEEILHYRPPTPFLAALALLGFYGVKSVTVVIPLLLLYLTAGLLFGPFLGALVNLLGLIVALTIPYCLGKFYGQEYMERLLLRRGKAQLLQGLHGESGFFLAFFTRVINLLPGDLVSMLLGAMDIGYGRYLLGSLLGMVPFMLAVTFVGVAITDPHSPAFFFACATTFLLSLGSLCIYHIRKKHHLLK